MKMYEHGLNKNVRNRINFGEVLDEHENIHIKCRRLTNSKGVDNCLSESVLTTTKDIVIILIWMTVLLISNRMTIFFFVTHANRILIGFM